MARISSPTCSCQIGMSTRARRRRLNSASLPALSVEAVCTESCVEVLELPENNGATRVTILVELIVGPKSLKNF